MNWARYQPMEETVLRLAGFMHCMGGFWKAGHQAHFSESN